MEMPPSLAPTLVWAAAAWASSPDGAGSTIERTAQVASPITTMTATMIPAMTPLGALVGAGLAALRRRTPARTASEEPMASRAAPAAAEAVSRVVTTAPWPSRIVLNDPVTAGSTLMGRGASSGDEVLTDVGT